MSELGKFNKWEPKEAVEVKKTYTTGQMVDAILENKKRTARPIGSIVNEFAHFLNDKIQFTSMGKTEPLDINGDDEKRKWTITEPEPEQVDFVTAIKNFKKGKNVKSVVSNNVYKPDEHYLEEVEEEEIDGKWIVKEAGV
jgi:hypothetical protein